jgi:hypothetical protein
MTLSGSLEINSDSLERVLNQLHALFVGAESDALLVNAGERVGEKVIELVGEYPRQSRKPLPVFYTRTRADGSTYRSKFKSRKQQGYVFGVLVKENRIPYRRTGNLGASFIQQTTRTPDGLIIKVSATVPYASLVVGDDDEQSQYHAGTWSQLGEIITDNETLLIGQLEQDLITAIEARLGGAL